MYPEDALPPGFSNRPEINTENLKLLDSEKEPNFYRLSFNLRKDHMYTHALVYAARKPHKLDSLRMKRLIAKIHLKGRSGFNLGKNLVSKRKHLAISFLDRYRRETKPIVIHLTK